MQTRPTKGKKFPCDPAHYSGLELKHTVLKLRSRGHKAAADSSFSSSAGRSVLTPAIEAHQRYILITYCETPAVLGGDPL